MMTGPSPIEGLRACSLAAGAVGESPIGWAIGGFRHVLVEVPLPWPEDADEASSMPPGLAEVMESAGRWDPRFGAIAPDPAWSIPGRTMVVLYDRSSPRTGAFTRREFSIARSDVADLVRAWRDGVDVGRGEPGLEDVRDILVCTHGSHDTCCGRFGTPIHRILRDGLARPDLRVWRGSHTGGHRFAPTLLDLPDGRSWGRLRPADAAGLVTRTLEPADLRDRYRGLGTLDSFQERLVEAELLFQHGWAWTELMITGAVVEGSPQIYGDDPDEAEDRAVVRITATDVRAGTSCTWEGVVERGVDLVTRGECGDEDWDLPSFLVTSTRLLVPEDLHA
jgi:hypothetical protein